MRAAGRTLPGTSSRPDATAVHQSAVVIDGLLNAAFSREYLLAMRAGGYTAAVVTLALPFYNHDRVLQTLRDVAEWEDLFVANPEVVVPIRAVEEITRAKETGRVGIIFGMQDGGPFGGDLTLLRTYRALGLRVACLTYNSRNVFADGCTEPANGGLSRLGREAIGRLNALGITLDLSHMGYRSALEAVELTSRPPILSHSNPLSLCDTPRNVPDELLDAVAAKGGVVGISPLPMLLTRKRLKPERTIEDFFVHLDYAVARLGVDHVAFGSDFYRFNLQDAIARNVAGGFLARFQREPVRSEEDSDPVTFELRHPTGLAGVEDVPNVTAGLLARRYGDADVRKILGENLLRVFRETWTGEGGDRTRGGSA